jgi:hypothetical protein
MELISEWEKQTGWVNVLTHSLCSGMTAICLSHCMICTQTFMQTSKTYHARHRYGSEALISQEAKQY